MGLLIRIKVCAGPEILQPRDHLESDDDGQTVTLRMQSTSPSLPFAEDLILQKSSEIMLCTSLESKSEVARSCPTLCDPMDCSISGSSVHGIFQARVLEWIAISFSRESSRPRNRTPVSRIAGRALPSEPPEKPRQGANILPAKV